MSFAFALKQYTLKDPESLPKSEVLLYDDKTVTIHDKWVSNHLVSLRGL